MVTIREITKKRLVPAQTKQCKDSAQFLSRVRHENLLEVWGLFWDDKKVYYIMEPAIQSVQLAAPPSLDPELNHGINKPVTADFIRKFAWIPTVVNSEYKYDYVRPSAGSGIIDP